MLLLALSLARDADVATLITTLAKAQKRSIASVAAESQVQKSALLRFCNRSSGGYLSQDARDRVLSALGWSRAGPSAERVHVWRLEEVAEARFLFQRALDGQARLSEVKQHDAQQGARLFVGAAAGAPMIVSATYSEDAGVDPLIADVGPFVPEERGQLELPALGNLAKVQESPKAFFAYFGVPSGSLGEVAKPSSAPDSPLNSLHEMGFEDDLLNALVEDFITLQCKIDPVRMRARYIKQIYGGPVLPDTFQKSLRPGVEAAAEQAIDQLARRQFALNWRFPVID